MTNELLLSIGFGVLGAVCRVLVTYVQMSHDNKKMNPHGFFLYAVTLLTIGAFSGVNFSTAGTMLSLLSGYAGMDLMDGYAKALKGKKVNVE